MENLNYKKTIKNIRNELETYIKENSIKSLIIGISGGLDSALCAVLAKPVCDKLKIKLHGRNIIMYSNKQDEIDRAKVVGKFFCHTFNEIRNLSNICEKFWSELEHSYRGLEKYEEEKIRVGNLMARLRMIYLYDLARVHSGMVLSTDNYTEYLLGFWTLHGDVGNFGIIQSLWKTEVYDMTEWICENELTWSKKLYDIAHKTLKACIDANATDGLGITKTDLDQIMPEWNGSSREGYKIVDQRLKDFINLGSGDLDDPVVYRHLKSSFKRNDPYNISRKFL